VTQPDGPVVRTTAGSVQGFTADGISVFRGVPYAAPPVGPLRYAKAVPPPAWPGVRPCVEYGAHAHQGTSREVADTRFPLPEPQDEDCLFLNVATSGLADASRPVFVYVHSGGYFLGSANSDYLDGPAFARDDVVFVSVTYRLNSLGFLYLDELFDGLHGTGNLGITDVVRALEWVQENIAAFGGDPTRVTVGGHSAGGLTSFSLLASPLAKGLFHRTVPISCAAAHSTILPDPATRVARRVLQEVGIRPGDLDALRSAPARSLIVPNRIVAELHALSDGHPLDPVADGDLLSGRAIDGLRDGAGAEVDVLVGVMSEEFRVIVFDENGQVRKEPLRMGVSSAGLDYMALFKEGGQSREQVEDVYRRSLAAHGRADTAAEIFAAASSDYVMLGPSGEAAEAHSRAGGNTYSYRFAWRPPAGGGLVGSQHGNDIPFFFNRVHTPEWRHLFQDQAPPELGQAYHDAIVAFTTTGDPNVPSLPPWQPYDARERATMIFDTTSTLVHDPDGERRELFAGLRGYHG
jgi:para-nitrobenzyl esterase